MIKDGIEYEITQIKIRPGDEVYCPASDTINLCIATYSDGDICVQNGSCRSIIASKHYKKVVRI